MGIPTGPFGELVSFANVTFPSGHTTGLQKFPLEFLTAYAPSAGRYPIDLRGLSDAPLKDPKPGWKVLVRADYSLHGPAAAAAVEAGCRDIIAALTTPYTYSSGLYAPAGTTVSGQVGDLVVRTADGSGTWVTFARLDKTDLSPMAGRAVYAYEVPLDFTILEEWVAQS